MGETTVGLLMFPIERSGVHPTANLIGILSALTHERIPLVTGNAGHVFENDARVRFSGVDHAAGDGLVSRILHNVATQARITCRIRELNHTDTWLFFFGGEVLVLPMLAAKLSGKKVVLALPGHTPIMMAPAGDRLLLPAGILTGMTCRLCDRIVLYSPALISHWGLERYKDKIAIAREHLLDFEAFRVETPLEERPATVAYIGRLADEKGVWNFVRALPRIAAANGDLNFLIGGDGPLLPAIRTYGAGDARGVDPARRPPLPPQQHQAACAAVLYGRAPEHHARGYGLRHAHTRNTRGCRARLRQGR